MERKIHTVLQGFQNLVGLKPQPSREFQTNNHVLAPYLQGFQNLAGSGTGDKKARRPINPKNKNSGLPATKYIVLILFQ